MHRNWAFCLTPQYQISTPSVGNSKPTWSLSPQFWAERHGVHGCRETKQPWCGKRSPSTTQWLCPACLAGLALKQQFDVFESHTAAEISQTTPRVRRQVAPEEQIKSKKCIEQWREGRQTGRSKQSKQSKVNGMPRSARLAAIPTYSPPRGKLWGFNLAKYGENFKVAAKEFLEWLTQSQAMQWSQEHEIS